MSRLAVVAAGGTLAGHPFPAQALAEALSARGWRVALATDTRGAAYAGNFPAEERIALSAATFKSGDPIGMVGAGVAIVRGVAQASAAFRRLRPSVVVGFGGYPSLPSLIAAVLSGRRTVIHEQNAVMAGEPSSGRAGHHHRLRVPDPAEGPAQRRGPRQGRRQPHPAEIRALADAPHAPPAEALEVIGHRRQPGCAPAVPDRAPGRRETA